MTKNVSPHVSIYKFPVTAISSIATRLSGLYLSGIFIGYGISKIYNKDEYFMEKYKKCERYQRFFLNQSVILPLTYHTLGGLRHFTWDKFPKLLVNTKVSKSSFLLFGLTITSSTFVEYILNDYL